MKALLAACIIAMSSAPGFADGDCTRYVHESEPSVWIEKTGYGFDWHKEGFVYPYEVGRYTNEDSPILTANTKDGLDAEMGSDDFIFYRFAEVNGHQTIIWAMTFYYRDCGAGDQGKESEALKQKPGLFDTLLFDKSDK